MVDKNGVCVYNVNTIEYRVPKKTVKETRHGPHELQRVGALLKADAMFCVNNSFRSRLPEIIGQDVWQRYLPRPCWRSVRAALAAEIGWYRVNINLRPYIVITNDIGAFFIDKNCPSLPPNNQTKERYGNFYEKRL